MKSNTKVIANDSKEQTELLKAIVGALAPIREAERAAAQKEAACQWIVEAYSIGWRIMCNGQEITRNLSKYECDRAAAAHNASRTSER